MIWTREFRATLHDPGDTGLVAPRPRAQGRRSRPAKRRHGRERPLRSRRRHGPHARRRLTTTASRRAAGARPSVGPGPSRPRRRAVRFARCSCAKFNAGYFNAYRRIAERDDLDFLLHLGDYIYEASQPRRRARRPAPTSAGRSSRTANAARSTSTGPAMPSTTATRTSRRSTARFRSSRCSTTTSSPTEPGRGARTLTTPSEHGLWSERARGGISSPARVAADPRARPRGSRPGCFRKIRIGDLADLFLLDIRSHRDRAGTRAGDERTRPVDARLRSAGLAHVELDSSTADWRLLATPSVMFAAGSRMPDELLVTALSN